MLLSNVTGNLSQIESSDPSAAEQLLPLVYNELRKLAHKEPGRRSIREMSATGFDRAVTARYNPPCRPRRSAVFG